MARRRYRYVENHKSFGEFIMSDQAYKPTAQVTQAIARRAEMTAPRSGDGRGVPYADSFEVKRKVQGIVAGKFRNRRVAATLANTAPHAPVVEFGSTDRGRSGERVMLKAGLKYGSASAKITSSVEGW